MMRIAVLEDDETQLELIRSVVVAMGHVCYKFSRGQDMLRELRRENFDMLMLDWNLPDISGLEVVRWVRANISVHVPVLFITNHVDEQDVVKALSAGADDYMSKPVRIPELLARLHALLRRAYPLRDQEVCSFGDYTFDLVGRMLSVRGTPVDLKNKEYELAYLLFSRMGELLSRKYLHETVWGSNAGVISRTLDTHICRLRVKLDLRPENGYRLTSVYSVGYRLEALPSDTAATPAAGNLANGASPQASGQSDRDANAL